RLFSAPRDDLLRAAARVGRHWTLARTSNGGITRHPCAGVLRVELLLGDDSHRPPQLLFAEPTPKVGAHPVTSVREHRTESDARLFESTDLFESDAPLGTERDLVG